jgi:hypothetical protein
MASVALFSHIRDPEQREALVRAYDGCQRVLDETLRRIILKKIETSVQKEEQESLYDKPNAMAFVSDQLGYRRALREILALLPTGDHPKS